MYWYAYDVCMHDMRKYEMTCYAQKCLINHALFIRACPMKLWQKGRHLSNPSSHIFCKFSHRVTLSRSSFIHIFFRKKFFFFSWSFSNMVCIFYQHLLFQTCQFFLSIFKHPKILYFFWRKRTRHSFFQFFSSFIQNKTLPYFEKETEWKTIFLEFFSEIQNTFFCFDESQFFWILMTS